MTDEERYRERVKDAFEKFLVSPFIEYKPYSVSDETIIADAKHRANINFDGGRLQWMQSFASIYTIEGAMDMEYNGKDFKRLILKSSNGQQLQINFSDFHYHNSFYTGKEDSSKFGFGYDCNNARFINLLDGKLVSPDSLALNIGSQILIGYYFNTVNRYDKMRTCRRLYSLTGNVESDAEIIRKQILRAQAIALLITAKYPVLCLPSYNGERIYPYMYDITNEVGSQYSSRLRVKLSEIEQALREHGLTYEHSI